MDAIQKAARVEKQALAGEELALINRQALKELTEEEVFVYRLLPLFRNFWKMTGICTGHLSREASSFPPMFYLRSHHLQRLVQRLYPSDL